MFPAAPGGGREDVYILNSASCRKWTNPPSFISAAVLVVASRGQCRSASELSAAHPNSRYFAVVSVGQFDPFFVALCLYKCKQIKLFYFLFILLLLPKSRSL